jgi:hypothetical protein
VPVSPLVELIRQRTYSPWGKPWANQVTKGESTAVSIGAQYDERFGASRGTGARLICRFPHQENVNYYIADRFCAVLGVPTRCVYPGIEPTIELPEEVLA